MSIFHNNALAGASGAAGGGAGGYQIQRSLRFNSADSAYLSRTPASAGNRKTWTWAGWVKRSALQSGTSNTYMQLFSAGASAASRDVFFFDTDTDDTLAFFSAGGGIASGIVFRTNAVFRDASAWMHIMLAVDTTQATAANRVKLYVNGTEQTFSTVSYPSQNAEGYINLNNAHYIATHPPLGEYFNGYLADIHFIDGQALTPSSFTETSATTGQLIPKAYTGTFTGNSFWLKFADNSAATATTLGKDSSGLGNNWTPNNLSVTAGAGNDSLTDTPTSYGTDTGAGGEVRGNYCTLNPLNRNSNANLSNGNLNFSLASAGVNYGTFATFGVRTGKWYFEASIDSFISYGITTGFVTSDWGKDYIGSGGTAYFGLDTTGGRRSSAGITAAGSTVTYGAGDVVGVAFDADAGTATIYKNGASVYTFSGIPANDYFPALSSGGSSAWINFGQRPFAYTAPSGFKALCDTNLPAPVVAKSSDYFQTVLWTGDTSTTRSITGLNFSPDLVWVKNRGSTYWNVLFDSVRGAGNQLSSNQTDAELASASNVAGKVSSFDANGFTLASGSSGIYTVNENAKGHVAWCFDAGSNTVSNTAGSITSSCRTNQSSGFSIATFTAPSSGSATIGHNLNAEPHMIIIKSRDQAYNWCVYHKALTSNAYFLNLNTTAAQSNTSNVWNNTTPTSTVFSLGSGYAGAGATVAYLFSPVAGYSSMGSYVGNGSADGPFVYTGFRPRWVMVKCSSAGGDSQNWVVHDTARDTSNVMKSILLPNLSNAELTTSASDGYYVDTLSNGFKIRTVNGNWNTSAATYVWAAFAESPFQFSRAR